MLLLYHNPYLSGQLPAPSATLPATSAARVRAHILQDFGDVELGRMALMNVSVDAVSEGAPVAFRLGELSVTGFQSSAYSELMEAMASGLGTVAFDDAAAAEHLRHDENGVKAAVDDDEAFITHAIRLADQPSLLNRVRHQARLDALDQTWDSQIEVFEQLVFNTPAKARHHGINKQSVSLF